MPGGRGAGAGGGQSMAPNFWPTNFFPRDFRTPNIRKSKTDDEKQNKYIYYSNKF